MTNIQTVITKVSNLMHTDLKEKIEAGYMTKEQANNLFRDVFTSPVCVEYMSSILNTKSTADRFYGFDLVTPDYTLQEALASHREVSDCSRLEEFHTIPFASGTVHIVGAYQDSCYAIDGDDYEDTWDYAFIIELPHKSHNG